MAMAARGIPKFAAPADGPAYLGAALLLAGAWIMLPNGRLHEFGRVPVFLLGAAVMAAGFLMALRHPARSVWLAVAAALAPRLLLLLQEPGDDIHRYIWEGRVLLAGWNPFLHAPDAEELAGLRDGLWPRVQHPSFPAIYPPLAQWTFAALSWIQPSVLFFKAAFLAADVGIAWLLWRRFGMEKALVYAWNPLVIYSFAGGGHYDALFVLAMVLGWMAWRNGRGVAAALWLGAAAALKWMALPLLAWAVWRMFLAALRDRNWRTPCWGLVAGAAPLAAAFGALGLWTGEWTGQMHSPKFSQYARSAEFLPGIAGWFWGESRYHNHWFLVPLAVAWAWVILRGKTFARTAEGSFFAALLLTPMLHAWYFTWIMPFAAGTRNRGAIAAAVSGFAYFMLYHHVESPGGEWLLRPWEWALLWAPYAAGFLWSAWRSPASAEVEAR